MGLNVDRIKIGGIKAAVNIKTAVSWYDSTVYTGKLVPY